MGKNSRYYREQEEKENRRFREKAEKLPDYAAQYLHSKKRNVGISTLVAYADDLLTFYEYLEAVGTDKKIGELTPEEIIAYGDYLDRNEQGSPHNNGSRAITRKLGTLRGMFAHLQERGLISSNPMLLVPLPKIIRDKTIVTLSYEEVQALEDAIENGVEGMTKRERTYAKKTQKRDRAIVSLMLRTGIRVAECNGLDLNDVNLRVNSITIVRKGGGQDVQYFDGTVKSHLMEYIETERKAFAQHKTDRESDQDALFLSIRGTRLSKNAMERLVRKYTDAVIRDKKITPHKLRSTYGTALYQETKDIRIVAEILGHSNINTTSRYYAALTDERKKSVVGLVTYQ